MRSSGPTAEVELADRLEQIIEIGLRHDQFGLVFSEVEIGQAFFVEELRVAHVSQSQKATLDFGDLWMKTKPLASWKRHSANRNEKTIRTIFRRIN